MGFSKDFLWGSASAAYQVEGGWDADGKGKSIWDVFSHVPGHMAHGETGDIACDHYHRFREDVALMKQMGLKSYRFSVSWPRVLPEGVGRVNEAGLQFYSDLVDALLEAGIEPMLTLYHWDQPYALYERGGWRNPHSSDWFAEYARVLVERLGDRVRYWMTLNEPQMFIGLGYRIAVHAPFEHVSDDEIILMTRNALLAHGKAVSVLRACRGDNIRIGLAPTSECFLPRDDSKEAIEEARRQSFSLGEEYFFSNSWWADPIFLGKLPDGARERFGERMYSFTEEEWNIVHQPLDFYGFNVYHNATAGADMEYFGENGYTGCPLSSFNWHITPKTLYFCPKFLYERYGLPLLVTENGTARFDAVSLDGKVHDPARIDFMHRYLLELRRAVNEGIPVLGYTYWSLMDNLEWNSGYDQRFGLIYVDYRDQSRIVKDSGWWYRDVIAANGENL